MPSEASEPQDWMVGFFICNCKENSIAIPNLNRVFEPHNNQKHHQEIKYLHILFEKKTRKKTVTLQLEV